MRIRIGLLVALAATGFGSMTAGTASAHKKKIATSISVTSAGVSGDNLVVAGRALSGNRRCRAGRTVRLIFVDGAGERRVVDSGRSSRRGYWAVGADPTGAAGGVIRIVRKRFGPKKNHRHVCAAVKVPLV